MDILLIGLNHKTTPIEVRERLAFSRQQLGEALQQLGKASGEATSDLYESVILSTCNRVEVYTVCKSIEIGTREIISFLSSFHQVAPEHFENHIYELSNHAAVNHLFRVSGGIDSMVVGESQIQSQVKEAFEIARRNGTLGPHLFALFENALRLGKRARTETDISKHSLSLSGAAINRMRTRFPDISQTKILVIGLGEMGVITVKTLFGIGARKVTVLNRSEERLENLLTQYPVRAFGLNHLEEIIKDTDVVICSTGAPHVVLEPAVMRDVMQQRQGRELLIIDIAVPRDVAPEVGKLSGVTLCNIDELKIQVNENLERRCNAINGVRNIIREEVGNYMKWYQSLKAKPVITQLRNRAEKIRGQEIQRALQRLEGELSERDTRLVHDLSRRIVNKLLHAPVTQLREEVSRGNGELYTAAVKHLFKLDGISLKK